MDKSRIALLLEHQLIDSVINVESTTPEMSAILPQASTTPISETMFPGFLRQQFLQFPDVVRESMTPSNSYSHGLFPQINRAWIITDKTLYLWNYHFESDLCKYTVPKGSISNCFLATPRPGAFVESVEFVLVVVASYDIILLGVVLDGRQPENRLQLVDTNYSTSTNSLSFETSVSFSNGRIFLSASNGNIYEFVYEPKEKLFQPNCRLIGLTQSWILSVFPIRLPASGTIESIVQMVADDDRNLLYVLLRSGLINMYSLERSGEGFVQVGSLDPNDLKKQFDKRVSPAVKSTKSLPIESIVPTSLFSIPPTESDVWCLCGITRCGIRLFFTSRTQSQLLSTTSIPKQSITPRMISLNAFYTPPFSSHQMVQAPSGPEKPSLPQTLNFAHAHSPYSSSGVTIISDTLGANEHILTAIGSSSEPISFRTADVSFTSSLANRNLNQLAFHRALSETISSYVTPTPFTAVHEVPLSSLITNTMTEASTFFLTYPWINSPGKQTTVSLPNTKPNSSIKYRRTLIRHPPLSVEKSLQHLYRPRMFLASNNDGILVFTRTRPIEHLSQLISTASRDSSAFMSQSSAIPELPNPIISFIDSFKPAEVCSMCLFLSSSSEPLTALSSSSDDSFFVPLFSKQGTVVQQSQTVQQTQQVEKKSKTRTTHGTPLFSSTLRDGSCNSLLITPLKSLNTPLPDRTPRNFDTPSRSSNRNMAVKLTPFSGGGSYPFGSPTFSPSQDSAIIRTTSYHSNSPLQICEIIAKKYSDSLSHFIPILTTSMTRVFVADPTTNSFPSLSSLYHSNIQLQAVQACSDKPLTSLHNGLVLFLARFLAPLWNTTIIKLTVLSNDQDPSKNKTSEKKTDKPWYHPRRILDLFTFLPSYEDLPEMDADLPETNPQQPPESSVQKLKRPQSGTVPLNQQRTVKFPSEAAPISSLQTPARSNAPLGYLTPPPNATMHQDLNPHADRLFQSLQTPSRFYPQNTVRPALPTTTTKTSDRKLIPTDLEYPFVYLGAFLRSSTQKTQTRLLDEGVSHVTSCAASLALHPSVILPFARTLSSFLKALSNCPSLLPSSPQLPSQAYQFLNTISSDPSGSLVRSVADVDNQISQLEESDFLQSLLAILTRSYEFLLFLLLLSDVGCPCVSSKEKDSPFIIFIRQAKKLPESTVSLTFKDLISSSLGSFVVSALIETATSHTSSENATLARMLDTSEKVSTAFHTFAPSFHTQHDTNVNKARSILKTVGEAVTSKTLSESERVNNETLLVSARDLLIQSIAHVSLDEFCPLFQALNKPGYCVSLAIAKAQNEDPTNAALAWVKGGRSTEDRIGTDRFNSRNVCYRWVVQTLEWESKYISYQYSRPIQYNQTPHPTGGLITPPTSSETILKCETFNIALQSDDVLLQYAVFGWMLTQPHLRPVLLNLNSPHLTTFLSSNTSNTGQQAEGAGDIDVLWEHYIRMNSLHKAATELRKLAKDPELVLERSNHRANHQNLLSLRIYYLTLASGCLSDPSATTGPTHSEKQILQLQIDVAKLQLDIRNEIVSKKDAISLQQPQPGQSREEEVKRCQEALLALDRQLYDATTLFKTFIVPFNLRSSTQKVSELLERYGDSPMSSFSS